METCVGVSSGTALLIDGGNSSGGGAGGSGTMSMDDSMQLMIGTRGKQSTGTVALSNGGCRCQCVQPLPVFRDDLRICVDDLQGECIHGIPLPYYTARSSYILKIKQ